jgi:glycosyltransferase 2 family protein
MQAELAADASPTERDGSTPKGTGSAAPRPPRRRHPILGFALRIGVGATIIALLLWHYNARPILDQLARERLVFFFAAVGLYVAGQVMSAWRWRLLGALLKIPAPFIDYLSYYFIGMFTNVFVPGLVGGDALRAIYLGRRHKRLGDAVASVFADRGTGLAGLFWLAAVAAAALSAAVPSTVRGPAILVGAGAFAGYALLPLLARLAARMPERIAVLVQTVEPYMKRPLSLIPAIALSVVLQLSLAVCQWLLALGLGLHVPLGLFVLCVPIANLFASLPITLNGLGVRETFYLMFFAKAGIGHADAIALGLLWFSATALGNLTGVIAFALTDTPPLRRAEAEVS